MATQITDALATYTNDVIKAKLLQYLQSGPTPVTDWNDSGFLRSLLIHWAVNGLGEILNPAAPDVKFRQARVSGPVPLLAAAPDGATSGWLTLACEQLFGLRRNYKVDGTQFAGTFTQQAVTLFCDAAHGPYSVVAGAFFLKSSVTGNRYKAITSGTIPNNGSVIITFQAESPNDAINGQSFADGAGTLTDIGDNPWPGVSASNLGPNFSGVIPTPNPATGLGVVTVSGTTPAAPTAYDVQITTSGQVGGAAVFEYRTNGGAWLTGNAVTSSFTIPSGPTIHFANDGGGANPSFIAGDVYSFQSPGTPITQQGLDPETDAALLIRCVARWPDLTVTPPEKHTVWAKKASPLVTRVRPRPNATPGFLDVTIAGKSNPLAGGVVTAVQLYIDQREAIGDVSVVATATPLDITAGGTVFASAANMAAVQAAAAVLWNAYVNATDIGGIVRRAKLEEFLMDAGALDVLAIAINGFNDVSLAANEVANPIDIIGSGLSWEVV